MYGVYYCVPPISELGEQQKLLAPKWDENIFDTNLKVFLMSHIVNYFALLSFCYITKERG